MTDFLSSTSTNHMQKKYDEAEENRVKVPQLRGEMLGRQHPDISSDMISLAIIYAQQNNCHGAENIPNDVVRLQSKC